LISVIFFRTESGNEPALDWLRSLVAPDRRTIGEDLLTVQMGWPIGMPVCRPLGAGLYEVRSNISDKRIARLLFFQHGEHLVVVEGFIKKTQATPGEVLDVAKRRKREYERNTPSLGQPTATGRKTKGK